MCGRDHFTKGKRKEPSSVPRIFNEETDSHLFKESYWYSLWFRERRIPSTESFPSLNLAQAVMVVGYELFQASIEIHKKPIQLARAEQLERMFEHMEKTLIQIGFLDSNHPKRIMSVLRRLFGRSQMDEREVRILHGIWSQMDRYLKGGRKAK